jgi:hypothetical protein
MADDRNLAVAQNGDMTHTLVSIYAVDDTGATGPQVGSGLLIGPELVLVHPPLGSELAAPNAPVLRVGSVTSAGDYPSFEIVDVARVLVSRADTGRPLVALALSRPTTSPVTPITQMGADPVKAVADYLEVVDAQVRGIQAIPGPPIPGPPWCPVWPDGPGC